MKTRLLILAGAAALATAGAAFAAVTFDPATGTGFVGKGDVQLALGLNNAQLQNQAASLQFSVASTVVTETSWLCTNTRNENTQERSRTTTETVQGVLSALARERNQITGFNLNGYAGGGSTSSSVTEGPQLNSCPTNWVLTPGTTTVDESSSSVLYVNGVPLQ